MTVLDTGGRFHYLTPGKCLDNIRVVTVSTTCNLYEKVLDLPQSAAQSN